VSDEDVLSWSDSDGFDGRPVTSMTTPPTTPGMIRLEGPATLAEAPETRRRLAAALDEGGPGKRLAVDLGGSGPWDLTGLQLLLATVTAGLRDGVTVRFRSIPGVCRDLAGRAGLGPWLDSHTDSVP
jgi:anti-anti-sigma regulatory factor